MLSSSDVRVFRVKRRRAVLVFWTACGGVLAGVGVVSLALQAMGVGQVAAEPVLVGLGGLVVAYVQLVYPAVTWLRVHSDGFVLRSLPGRRAVSWAQVGGFEAVLALAPAGRGGNLGGVRVRDADGRLILIVPDVFEVGAEMLKGILQERWQQARPAPSRD